ncbi:glycosyltransferase family 2 protein [Saliterribacillus persicus]|uniref:Glycosyltransferase involved in cell wall biosynthesis n=1 Tax=Saliterribacillus persicus TaxID=930114 RepID=A0A368X4J1_9BACI|nr:glycosyltransferase family A protein [Saliterribacillus persicus]RCW62853.1 glycosyltransferase involved in cell wall biosynthesis [Saliterribacillus persicus]
MCEVTVVVPTYNKANYINKALESIFAQTFPDFKLLLIDDASTDHTVSLLNKYKKDNRTKLIEKKVNTGICDVLNIALKHIDTPYFIQVDGDDWIEPHTLEVMYEKMVQLPKDVALLYANTIHWHERNGFLQLEKRVAHRPFRDRYDFATYDPMVQPRFYRTQAIQSVGGWEIDELTKGRYMEDRRMLLKLYDVYQMAHVDQYLYHFRYHQNNLSLDKNAWIYNQVRKHLTEQAIKRWGNAYKVHMVGPENLWQSIELIPITEGSENDD